MRTLLLIVVIMIIRCDVVFAVGMEEAINQCRQKVRPTVQACVR
jgi:hypothetical protein